MKGLYIVIVILSISGNLFSQDQQDSLVVFSGLKFHSEFEKKALTNFIQNRKDTFNLFMAIDEHMTPEIADICRSNFNQVFVELDKQKIQDKSTDRKIKIAYSVVHKQFLKKYDENVFFPQIFKEGTYDCVTASLLYALVFDRLKVPYKVMSSKNHIYLIANPGHKSVVIETTNPSFEKAIFNGNFKQQYVDNLKSSKMISDEDTQNKSVEEIFSTKFNELNESKASNLPGFQYYNKAFLLSQNSDFDKAYNLVQKAYYFFPDQQVKSLFIILLAYKLDKCEFKNLEDADMVVQLSRLDPTNVNQISGVFDHMIAKNLQYTDRVNFCDSLYQRVRKQITNKKMLDEIAFSYNMTMAYNKTRRFNINESNLFVRRALKIKPTHRDAISFFDACLTNDLQSTEDYSSYLDSLNSYEKEFADTPILQNIMDYKLMVYLKISEQAFPNNKLAVGEKYMALFENNFKLPVKNIDQRCKIENAYYEYASYFARKKNKAMMDKIISKGLKWIPNSNMIQSAKDNFRVVYSGKSKMMIAPE